MGANETRRKPSIYTLVRWMLLICAGAVVVRAFSLAIVESYSDTFYQVAAGRWIIEHGSFPTTNFSSPVDGMGYISQNWLMGILAYTLYGIFDNFYILSATSFAAACLTAFLSTRIAKHYWGKDIPLYAIGIIMLLFIMYTFVFRAQAFVLPMTMFVLYASKRTVDDGKWTLLVPVLLFTVIHSNIQTTTVITEPLIMIAYGLYALVLKRNAKAAGQLLAFALLSGACMFVNPYAPDALLFIKMSPAVMNGDIPITEMSSLVGMVTGIPYGNFDVATFMYITISSVFVAFLIAAQIKAKRINVVETLFAAVGVIASIMAIRNCLYLAIFMWWLTVVSWDTLKESLLSLSHSENAESMFDITDTRLMKNIVPYMIITAITSVIIISMVSIANSAKYAVTSPDESREFGVFQPSEELYAKDMDAITIMKRNTVAGESVLMAAPGQIGSICEFLELKTNISSRFETWEPEIHGIEDAHWGIDSCKMCLDDVDALNRILSVYDDWDYVLVFRENATEDVTKRIMELGYVKIDEIGDTCLFGRETA